MNPHLVRGLHDWVSTQQIDYQVVVAVIQIVPESGHLRPRDDDPRHCPVT